MNWKNVLAIFLAVTVFAVFAGAWGMGGLSAQRTLLGLTGYIPGKFVFSLFVSPAAFLLVTLLPLALLAFHNRTKLLGTVSDLQTNLATANAATATAQDQSASDQETAAAAEAQSTIDTETAQAATQRATAEQSRADAAEQRVIDLESELETVADVTRQLSFLDDDSVASASAAAATGEIDLPVQRVEELPESDSDSDNDSPADEESDTSARQQMLFS